MKRTRDRRGVRAPGTTTEYDRGAGPDALFGAQARRKQEQLCRQVEERIGLVLAGEVDDPLLQDVYVARVQAALGSADLIVCLAFPPGRRDQPVAAVLRRIEALRPFLREEIAAAIHRKRTPGLVFRFVREDELAEEEAQ